MTNNRILKALIIGFLASVTAIAYIFTIDNPKVDTLFMAGLTAFVGAGCAGYTVAKGSPRTIMDVITLILLGDRFAFFVFMFGVLAVGTMHDTFSPNADAWHMPSSNTTWQKFLNIAQFYASAFVIGNVLTRGVGFIMMLPPVLLLLARDRDPMGVIERHDKR